MFRGECQSGEGTIRGLTLNNVVSTMMLWVPVSDKGGEGNLEVGENEHLKGPERESVPSGVGVIDSSRHAPYMRMAKAGEL